MTCSSRARIRFRGTWLLLVSQESLASELQDLVSESPPPVFTCLLCGFRVFGVVEYALI